MAKYRNIITNHTKIFKALSDEHRLRIVAALIGTDELCVCQINELFDLAGSTVSKHLSVLQNAGIISARKQGRWIYYRLADNLDNTIVGCLDKLIGSDKTVAADKKKLAKAIKLNRQALCERTNRK